MTRSSTQLSTVLQWLFIGLTGLLTAASALIVVIGDSSNRGMAVGGMLFFGAGTYVLVRDFRGAPGRRGGPQRPGSVSGTLRISDSGSDPMVVLTARPAAVGGLVSAVLAGLGTGAMVLWARDGSDSGLLVRLAGWAGLVFFTGGGLLVLANVVRRCGTLTLSPVGVQHRGLLRQVSLPWARIRALAVRQVERHWFLEVEHGGDVEHGGAAKAAGALEGSSGVRTQLLLPLEGTSIRPRELEWKVAGFAAQHGASGPIQVLATNPDRTVTALTAAATAEHTAFLFVGLLQTADGRRTLIDALAADPGRLVPVAIRFALAHPAPMDAVIVAGLARAELDWAGATTCHDLLPPPPWVDADWDDEQWTVEQWTVGQRTAEERVVEGGPVGYWAEAAWAGYEWNSSGIGTTRRTRTRTRVTATAKTTRGVRAMTGMRPMVRSQTWSGLFGRRGFPVPVWR